MPTETSLHAPVQDLIDALEWRSTTLEGRPFEQATFAEGALDAIQAGLEALRGMPELVRVYCAVAELASKLHQQGQGQAAAELLPLADALEVWAFEVPCPAEDADSTDGLEAQGPQGLEQFTGDPRALPTLDRSAPSGALSLFAARCEGVSSSQRHRAGGAASSRRRRRLS